MLGAFRDRITSGNERTMVQTQSPFSTSERRSLTFGMDWLLLVTFVAAATALMLGYALFLPSVRAELNAWLGRPTEEGQLEDNRRMHIIFLMMCYSAPLVLGLVARLVHFGGRYLAERLQPADDDDSEFRME